MPIAVRRASEEDAASLLALRRALFTETDFMLWEPQEFNATAEDEGRFISWLSAKTNSVLLVADGDSELIGFLGATGVSVQPSHLALAEAPADDGVHLFLADTYASQWLQSPRSQR